MFLSLLLSASLLMPRSTVDRTAEFLSAVRTCSASGGGVVELKSGTYHFYSHQATPVEIYVSNHDQPMPRPVQLPLESLTNVTVRGNGSLFLFHGEASGFLIRHCRRVKLEGIAMDWAIPSVFEGTIVATPPGGTEIAIDRARHPYRISNGRLVVLGEDWEHPEFRESKLFDGRTHEVVRLAGDTLDKGYARQLPNGNVLLKYEYAKAGVGGKPGDKVCLRSRTKNNESRPCPGVIVDRSTETTLEDFIIHTAFGMGLIAQMSDTVTWRGTKGADAKTAGMFPRAGTGRYASANADASHFSNVKGLILEEGLWFEGMMDDAINIHSTCLAITNVISQTAIRCRYRHEQAIGFDVFGSGDKLRLIRGNTLETGAEIKIDSVERHGEWELTLHLAEPLPKGWGAGDAVENADYQPSVVFRGNVVTCNRARGSLFTTPKPVLVESNRFELVSGCAILFAGDAHYWFESGACQDVTVRGNVFSNCLTSAWSHGFCNGIISAYPIVHELDKQEKYYHANITIEDNLIYTFDATLFFGISCENCTWRRNRVIYNDYCPAWKKPKFVFTRCRNMDFPQP